MREQQGRTQQLLPPQQQQQDEGHQQPSQLDPRLLQPSTAAGFPGPTFALKPLPATTAQPSGAEPGTSAAADQLDTERTNSTDAAVTQRQDTVPAGAQGPASETAPEEAPPGQSTADVAPGISCPPPADDLLSSPCSALLPMPVDPAIDAAEASLEMVPPQPHSDSADRVLPGASLPQIEPASSPAAGKQLPLQVGAQDFSAAQVASPRQPSTALDSPQKSAGRSVLKRVSLAGQSPRGAEGSAAAAAKAAVILALASAEPTTMTAAAVGTQKEQPDPAGHTSVEPMMQRPAGSEFPPCEADAAAASVHADASPTSHVTLPTAAEVQDAAETPLPLAQRVRAVMAQRASQRAASQASAGSGPVRDKAVSGATSQHAQLSVQDEPAALAAPAQVSAGQAAVQLASAAATEQAALRPQISPDRSMECVNGTLATVEDAGTAAAAAEQEVPPPHAEVPGLVQLRKPEATPSGAAQQQKLAQLEAQHTNATTTTDLTQPPSGVSEPQVQPGAVAGPRQLQSSQVAHQVQSASRTTSKTAPQAVQNEPQQAARRVTTPEVHQPPSDPHPKPSHQTAEASRAMESAHPNPSGPKPHSKSHTQVTHHGSVMDTASSPGPLIAPAEAAGVQGADDDAGGAAGGSTAPASASYAPAEPAPAAGAPVAAVSDAPAPKASAHTATAPAPARTAPAAAHAAVSGAAAAGTKRLPATHTSTSTRSAARPPLPRKGSSGPKPQEPAGTASRAGSATGPKAVSQQTSASQQQTRIAQPNAPVTELPLPPAPEAASSLNHLIRSHPAAGGQPRPAAHPAASHPTPPAASKPKAPSHASSQQHQAPTGPSIKHTSTASHGAAASKQQQQPLQLGKQAAAPVVSAQGTKSRKRSSSPAPAPVCAQCVGHASNAAPGAAVPPAAVTAPGARSRSTAAVKSSRTVGTGSTKRKVKQHRESPAPKAAAAANGASAQAGGKGSKLLGPAAGGVHKTRPAKPRHAAIYTPGITTREELLRGWHSMSAREALKLIINEGLNLGIPLNVQPFQAANARYVPERSVAMGLFCLVWQPRACNYQIANQEHTCSPAPQPLIACMWLTLLCLLTHTIPVACTLDGCQ